MMGAGVAVTAAPPLVKPLREAAASLLTLSLGPKFQGLRSWQR
ncbi:hypothetical protein BV96_02257 [Sphingomonas paucimobilis]|nr:hypothetical protein BV96_02257 [Sphingomonas paucimobilis]